MKNRIRQILKEKGMSQAQLADTLGVRPVMVWKWCENLHNPRSMSMQKRVAEALECDYSEVFYIPKKD